MPLCLPSLDLDQAYARVVTLLAEARDVVLERGHGADGARWPVQRGWRDYLLGLSEDELERADTQGIAAWFRSDPRCPASLSRLAERTLAVTASVPLASGDVSPVDFPFMNGRKRGQVAAVLHLLREAFAGLSEIVDVGAGRGQLTARAASALSVPALGLEKDPERVAVARALAGDLPVRFVAADVLSTDNPLSSLPVQPHRLLMALHGCGELGDALVTAAVKTKAAVLLLACCPQKIRGTRRPPLVAGGPEFPRDVLGLANVFARVQGVENDLRQALATKETRLALRCLLAARGIELAPGEDMRGVNRRKVNAGLAAFASAVCQLRGLTAPSADELAAAAGRAHANYLAQRRLSLPRSMLGRALEVFLALDRALFLQRHGYHARVVELFPAAHSPRNLAVWGQAGESTRD